ncbi:MAG: hypothetical protein CMD98_06420 [Gammaproteobacteria bacterium]|nr:hypothetical protein [Gammaproteobacteria bacterium]|tara:strand:+ start:652 stop:1965 length:1314 start_codon:yes stop_codon:yes gene_type:complete
MEKIIPNTIFGEMRESDDLFLTDNSVEYTYTQVKERVKAYTFSMQRQGILKCHRLALSGPNTVETWCFFLAAIRYCSVVCFPPGLPKEMFERRGRDVLNVNYHVKIKDDGTFLYEFFHNQPTRKTPGEYHFWWSSGTSSGTPMNDFAILDRFNYDKMELSIVGLKKVLGDTPCKSINMNTPQNASTSEIIITSYILGGSVHCTSFEKIDETLHKYKPKFFYSSPNCFKKLMKYMTKPYSLEKVVYYGAPLEPKTRKELKTKFDNPEVWCCFGITECGWISVGTEGLGEPIHTEQGRPYIREDGRYCWEYPDGSIFESEDYIHEENGIWYYDYRADSIQQTSNGYKVYVEDVEHYYVKRFNLTDAYINVVDDVASLYYVGIMPEHHKNIVREEITHNKLKSAIPTKYYQMDNIEFETVKVVRSKLPEMYDKFQLEQQK